MGRKKRRRGSGRRVFPAKYASDYINVTQAPAQIVYDPKDPDHWFNYQGRVRSVKGPKNNKEPDYNGPFTKQVPSTVGKIKHSYYDKAKQCLVYADPTPQMEIKALQRMWVNKGGNKHGVDTYHCTVFSAFGGIILKLFFSGNSFFWFKECQEGWCQISIEYVGRDQAMRVYELERIAWQDKEPL